MNLKAILHTAFLLYLVSILALTACFKSSKKVPEPVNYKKILERPGSLKKLIMPNKGLYKKLVSGEVDKSQFLEMGEQFLNENKKRKGVKVHAKGFQYEVLLENSEGQKPTLKSEVVVNSKVYLIDGKILQNSFESQPMTINNMDMILGWKLALPEMRVGSIYRLYFPPKQAYGENSDGHIPANAVLIYEIELLKINK